MTNPQIIPHSKEAEEAYLGSCLISPDVVKETKLTPNDFYIHRHRWIFEALVNSDKKQGATDFLLVSGELEERGYLEEVGGGAYLTALINNVPTSMHAEQYQNTILDLSERRNAIEVANGIAKNAYEGSMNWSHHISEINKTIRSEGGMQHVSEATKSYWDYVLAREENPSDVWGIPWPWGDMNKLTGGIHTRRSNILMGDTGIGKTVALGQIGFFAASPEGGYNRVRMFEMEMYRDDIIAREISSRTRISDWRVHRGRLTPAEKERIRKTLDELDKLPIYISDATHWTSADIRADISKNGADLVLIDHLGKLKDRAESEHIKMKIASENIRDMAKNLNVAVISVGTQVKDGTLEGVKRVQYEQDEIFLMEKGNGAERTITPSKQRHGGGFARVNLVMVKDLPRLEQMAQPYQEEQEAKRHWDD